MEVFKLRISSSLFCVVICYQTSSHSDSYVRPGPIRGCTNPSAWRKVAEHLVNALADILDVFGGVVRERIACRTAPDQLLLISVEDVDHECADLVGFNGRRGVPKAAEPPPAPTAPETIVEGIQRLLIVRCFDCYDSSVRTGRHFCPPLRG